MRDAALKSVLGGVRDVALFINFQEQTYPNHFFSSNFDGSVCFERIR